MGTAWLVAIERHVFPVPRKPHRAGSPMVSGPRRQRPPGRRLQAVGRLLAREDRFSLFEHGGEGFHVILGEMAEGLIGCRILHGLFEG